MSEIVTKSDTPALDKIAAGYSAQDLLLALMETIPVNLFFKDRKSRFILASKNTAKHLGAAAIEDIIGYDDHHFFDAIHANKTAADERRLVSGEVDSIEDIEEEVRFDGSHTFVKTIKLPLFSSAGESIVGVLGMSMDVTEQIKAEAALRAARDEAEAVGTELEATLEDLISTQNQLLQAQKLEAIGQLAAGVAHEINTPIQYVTDNANFIATSLDSMGAVFEAAVEVVEAARAAGVAGDAITRFDELNAESAAAELIEEIPDAAREALEGTVRVTEIVRALKAFSHPGSRDGGPVDLNELVTTTLTISRNEWKYVSEVATELEKNLPMVEGHANQLHQVLLILVVNSAQAIAECVAQGEKGVITIGTRSHPADVELWVRDTGNGIPEDIAARVFDPFYTTKEIGVGSGQGLSIAHAIVVEKHRGRIDFESEAGVGTTFTVRLPRHGRK